MTPDTRTALEKIIQAYDAYRGRGVNPAPGEYAAVVKAIEQGRALLSTSPVEPEPNEDHGIECGFIGDPKQPDIYIELPDSCGDVMSEEDEHGKLD